MANTSFDQKLRAWVSPALIVVVGYFLRDQYQEIRSDVKALLKSDSQTVTTVAAHEDRLKKLEGAMYGDGRERVFAIKQDEIEAPKRKQ